MPSSLLRVVFVVFVLGTVTTVSGGTLSVPLQRRGPSPEHYKTLARAISRRATDNGTAELTALNNITAAGYYVDFSIGTPGQSLKFQLDTGSSDTWMNSPQTRYCRSAAAQSQSGYCTATFKPEDSKTFSLVDEGGFDITYLDDQQITGDYFNDTVTIDGHEITNQQLGLALSSSRATGIVGLGFSANVATSNKYPTIVDNMVDQGIIAHPSFSLYLNGIDAQSGTILFGGIDSAKYLGSLASLPLRPMPNDRGTNVTSYAIAIKSLSATGVKVPPVAPESVAILDSGSTICLVPDSIANPIQDKFGVVTLQAQGGPATPLIDCAWKGGKGKGAGLSFGFGGKTINVPIADMAVDNLPEEAQQILKGGDAPPVLRGWGRVCLFGLGGSRAYGVRSDRFYLLGDTFLRSAYVAYDLANRQVGLAQSNVNATGSNVVEIQKGAKSLPNVTGSDGPGPEVRQDSASGRNVPSSVAAVLVLGAAVAFSAV
ncbi:Peptidase A1 [Metarhizium album ARSEF 1941]|uniref:Peptidase A1 n=1 Tax=Metarhizium album (strain ARSEF 1941) TaxID=1081103 RepID=A0A0B2X4H2_METAS|nr:Peptidase A1 [Metarhizium album ARSEF 1941]KHO00201.1 Peptidase A1 [Metarhizium album ARSEF 1941]